MQYLPRVLFKILDAVLVNLEHLVQHLVKEQEEHVQLFLKHLQILQLLQLCLLLGKLLLNSVLGHLRLVVVLGGGAWGVDQVGWLDLELPAAPLGPVWYVGGLPCLLSRIRVLSGVGIGHGGGLNRHILVNQLLPDQIGTAHRLLQYHFGQRLVVKVLDADNQLDLCLLLVLGLCHLVAPCAKWWLAVPCLGFLGSSSSLSSLL